MRAAKIIVLLIVVALLFACGQAPNTGGADGLDRGCPRFIEVGKTYMFKENLNSGQTPIFTVAEIGNGGWIKANFSDGTNSWLNTNHILMISAAKE